MKFIIFLFLLNQQIQSCVNDSISLLEIYEILQTKIYIDLTHTFSPSIPHQNICKPQQNEVLYNYKQNGFQLQQYTFTGQWGTHINSPSFMFESADSVDKIDTKKMLLPLVIIDIHEQVLQNPTYQVTLDDIQQWELKHDDEIPSDSFVVLRTNWHKRWPSQEKMINANKNQIPSYPGWSLEVLQFLCQQRNITAVGHEQINMDRGEDISKYEFPLQSYIFSQNKFIIQQMSNLDKVPEYGALISVTFPKPNLAESFPARVFAILPGEYCSKGKRILANQWGTIITILIIMLIFVVLIWYFCLKRFEKYNKEQFHSIQQKVRQSMSLEQHVPLNNLQNIVENH